MHRKGAVPLGFTVGYSYRGLREVSSPRGDLVKSFFLSVLRASAIWSWQMRCVKKWKRTCWLHTERLLSVEADEMIDDYRHLIQLTRPEVIPYPDADSVQTNRRLMRHESDVPVVLSAMVGKPDWLPTKNTKRFTQTVAQRTNLRIATPVEFFKTLPALLK